MANKDKYQILQDVCNKLLEKGWKLPNITFRGDIVCKEEYICFYKDGVHQLTISYHDLFSKDSGFMEAVEWKVYDDEDDELRPHYISNQSWGINTVIVYHYMAIATLTAEEKIDYILEYITL